MRKPQWTEAADESLHTFVNTILTSQGGTHAEGFREAVTSTVARCAKKSGLRDDAVCRGLTAVVNVTMADPQFAGPTKEYLANPEVGTFVRQVVVEHLSDWLAHHPDEVRTIVRHCAERRQAVSLEEAEDQL